jgi:hypothetical protein
MKAAEVHSKLGQPAQPGTGQDFYTISDKESVQVFYDSGLKVKAIAINYLGEGGGVPACKDVLGIDAEPAADGAVYKLVRYPRAGYWVSYNRTGGEDPLITVTLQKLVQ